MFYPAFTSMNTSNKSDYKRLNLINILIVSVLFLALIIVTKSVQADESEGLTTVYKVVDADGSVSFSDQPKAESEAILVPPIATVPAITPGREAHTTGIKVDKPYNRYHSLAILAPANNSAFYSGSGEVDVLLDIQPALIEGDQIQIFLDGQLVPSNNEIQSRLQMISRGLHELQVKLVSKLGKVHKEAFSTFTVHRPSTRN